MDKGLVSPNSDAPLNKQGEEEGHEEESMEHFSRRKNSPNSRRRKYRKRSPASQSPEEGSPKRRSSDLSPSSSKRSRDSDHRGNSCLQNCIKFAAFAWCGLGFCESLPECVQHRHLLKNVNETPGLQSSIFTLQLNCFAM